MSNSYNLMSERMQNKLLDLLRQGKRPMIGKVVSMSFEQIGFINAIVDCKTEADYLDHIDKRPRVFTFYTKNKFQKELGEVQKQLKADTQKEAKRIAGKYAE